PAAAARAAPALLAFPPWVGRRPGAPPPPLLDQIGDRVTDLGTFPGRACLPARLRGPRRRDRGVDVGPACIRRLGDRLARDRRDDAPHALAVRCDPCSPDEVVERPYRDRHFGSSLDDDQVYDRKIAAWTAFSTGAACRWTSRLHC